MKLSITKQVQVAKERALSELGSMPSYLELTEVGRKRIRNIGRLLAAPDNSKETLQMASELNFIDGDEELYFPAKTP